MRLLLLCGSTVCRYCRSPLASASEVQSTRTVGSRYLVTCNMFPACAVPSYCFCLRWICNTLSGVVCVHVLVPPWGSNPVCLTLCSRSSAVCLSWHLDRHVTLLAFLALVRQVLPLVVRLLPDSVPRALVAVSVGLAPAVAATTCRSQWRREAIVLGSLPLRTLGSLGPLPSCALMPPTLLREFLFSVAVRPLSLWVASPGVLSQLPASLGRFLGRRPFVRSTIAQWQEATDPQSPEGGSQRACTHGGCPHHGFWATRFSS